MMSDYAAPAVCGMAIANCMDRHVAEWRNGGMSDDEVYIRAIYELSQRTSPATTHNQDAANTRAP